MKSIEINENVKLNYISMTKLKTTSVGVYIHSPLNEKTASYNALLALVLKSASREYPSMETIAESLDDLYGATMGASVLKMGEDHIIYFDAETISDKYTPNGEELLSGLLKLLMSVIFDPKLDADGFDAEIVEKERKNAIDRIDAFINEKRQYASSRCQAETARGTDFAIMRFGNRDIISKITPKELYEYYKSIINSSVIDIYVCGDADIDTAANSVREYTNSIDFKKGKIRKTEIINRDVSKVNNVTEEMKVAQGKLAMGYLTNIKPTDDDYYALVVFNSVFGAGAHSKLFNNVREKLSLAYYASSQLEKYKGILVVNAGIEFPNFEKARDEVMLQLEEIKKGNITDHEFSSSISAIVNTCNSYYDDQRALASFYLSEGLMGTRRSLESYIENIKKVTPQEVSEVAKKLQLDTVYFLKGEREDA